MHVNLIFLSFASLEKDINLASNLSLKYLEPKGLLNSCEPLNRICCWKPYINNVYNILGSRLFSNSILYTSLKLKYPFLFSGESLYRSMSFDIYFKYEYVSSLQKLSISSLTK